MKSLFSFKSKYSIKDQNGVPRLYTEELDFLGTDVKIFDGHKNLVVEMKKPMFSFRQKWEVRIYGPVDRRIIAMVPTFLSAIQKRKASDYDGFWSASIKKFYHFFISGIKTMKPERT